MNPVQLDLDRRHRPGTARASFTSCCSTTGGRRCSPTKQSRETLDCIRCGACLNACPVYRQTGGHAYGSIYSGPIGAILTPQLQSMEHSRSLPYASSLCGACYEVCPVKINIPEILIHLRQKIVEHGRCAARRARGDEGGAGFAFADAGRLEARADSWRAWRSGRSCATAGSSICRRR